MPENFNYRSSTKRMACHRHLVDMIPILPLPPVDASQPARCTTDIPFASKVLTLDLLAISSTDDLQYTVGLLQLAETQFDLRIAKFVVNTTVIVRRSIVGIVLGKDVVLWLLANHRVL
jgi:hypothetical protein